MNKPISREGIIYLLRSHDFGVLATYGGEYPYTSLISIDVSADADRIFFPTMRQTKKYTNILHETRVSVLFDNRIIAATDPENTYAMTVMGRACEVQTHALPELRKQFIMRHPNLGGFLSQPETALLQIAILKVILVEQFQQVREFDWA